MRLLRSAVFNAWGAFVTFGLGFLGIPIRLFAPHLALGLSRFWARAVLAGARSICGIYPVILGQEHLPTDGPALIASEHQSAFDTVIWLALMPRVSYVVKRELTRIPLFGPLLRPAGQIVVDRGAGAGALRSLLQEADRAMADRRQIVIFPEGTRVQPGDHVPLHPGITALAARTRLPVVPVATDSGRVWGRRAFRKGSGPIYLAVGPPISPDTPRAQVTSVIVASWAEARRLIPGPVDKSVS